MKALVGAFNQEKALVGAFSVIVKTSCGTDGSICGTSWEWMKKWRWDPRCLCRHLASAAPTPTTGQHQATAARLPGCRDTLLARKINTADCFVSLTAPCKHNSIIGSCMEFMVNEGPKHLCALFCYVNVSSFWVCFTLIQYSSMKLMSSSEAKFNTVFIQAKNMIKPFIHFTMISVLQNSFSLLQLTLIKF